MPYDDTKGIPLPDDDLVLPRPLTPAQHTEFKQILERHYKEKISDQEVADAYRDAMTVIYPATTADLRKEEKETVRKAQEDILESGCQQQLMK